MRIALLSLLLIACSKDPQPSTDASIHIADATPPNTPSTDAPSMNVTTACLHACDAISACAVGRPTDPDCNVECVEDLADCTDEQVATIDTCTSEPCGDIENNDSPLFTCITAVSCVGM
jgi:hypothetical protein